MAWNWKQFIILLIIWIVTIIIITGSPVREFIISTILFIISTILFIWGIQKIRKEEKLKRIYISFIVFIVSVLAFNFIGVLSIPSIARNMELQSFYQTLIEYMHDEGIRFVCISGLSNFFSETCPLVLRNKEVKKEAIEGCKRQTKITCETGSFHALCYERLQKACRDGTYTMICIEDRNTICNEITRKYCSDNEIENYCSKLLQKICTINLQDYCKQFFKYV